MPKTETWWEARPSHHEALRPVQILEAGELHVVLAPDNPPFIPGRTPRYSDYCSYFPTLDQAIDWIHRRHNYLIGIAQDLVSSRVNNKLNFDARLAAGDFNPQPQKPPQ